MRAGMVGLAALYWPIALGRALHEHPGVQFLGAATLDADERLIHETLGLTPQEYAQRFGVHLYADAEEMVRAERLDTVVIVSRHTEHAVWVERMAGLGVDIFIPKTFATTLADADRIVAAGRRHGVRVAVGPSARFLPAMLAVKQALDAGRIGRPFAMRLCHHHGTIDVFHPNDWYRDPDEGGPELSLGWYGVDLVLHLMGESVETVAARVRQLHQPRQPLHGLRPHRNAPRIGRARSVRYVLLQPRAVSFLATRSGRYGGRAQHPPRWPPIALPRRLAWTGQTAMSGCPCPKRLPVGRASGLTTSCAVRRPP